MVKKKTNREISNQVYGLNISEELFALRDQLCPSQGSVRCANSCPIYQEYFHRGLSCNQALDKFPKECTQLITGASEVVA